MAETVQRLVVSVADQVANLAMRPSKEAAASKAHGSTLNPGNLAAHNDANTVGAIDLGLAPGDVRGTDEDVFAGVFSKMNSMQEFDQQGLSAECSSSESGPSTSPTLETVVVAAGSNWMGPMRRVANEAEAAAATKQMLLDVIDASPHGPAHVVDLGDVHRKLKTWKAALPRVSPFYAVKCNNDPHILSALASLGTGFDCATEAEFRSMIGRGVSPKNIVYAHPCKQRTQVLAAKELGVEMMTFDNADELDKLAKFYPEAKLILRIMADDSQSICKFNSKFAASKAEHPRLLDKAMRLKLNVVGVSFHVGSGCESAAPFADAVSRAREAWALAESFGFAMSVLDLGGGFPGDTNCPVSFEDIVEVLAPALEEHFPVAEFPASKLRIIAEPGRYFVASCSTLATRVIAKRSAPAGDAVMYYINDGVYGAFNCVLYDHQIVYPQILKAEAVGAPMTTTVWGPSCDSMDLVKKDFQMEEVVEGDWLWWQNMGAYTFCAQSTFNGFTNSTPFYTYSAIGEGAAEVTQAETPPHIHNLVPTAEADYVWKTRPEY